MSIDASTGGGNITTLAHAAEIYSDPSHPDRLMAGELLARENGGVPLNDAQLAELRVTGEIASTEPSLGGNPFAGAKDAGQQIAEDVALNAPGSNVNKKDFRDLQAKLQTEAVGPEGSEATKQAARLAGMGGAVDKIQQRADVNAKSFEEHMNARPGETLEQTKERMETEQAEKEQEGEDKGFFAKVAGFAVAAGGLFGLSGKSAEDVAAIKANDNLSFETANLGQGSAGLDEVLGKGVQTSLPNMGQGQGIGGRMA